MTTSAVLEVKKAIAPAPKKFVSKVNTKNFRVVTKVRENAIEKEKLNRLLADGTAIADPKDKKIFYVKCEGYERSGLVFHLACAVFEDNPSTTNWCISHKSGWLVTSSAVEYYSCLRSDRLVQRDCPKFQMWNMFRSLTSEDWSSLNITSQSDLKRLKAATDRARLTRLG